MRAMIRFGQSMSIYMLGWKTMGLCLLRLLDLELLEWLSG